MKTRFELSSIEVVEAAIKDAPNFNIKASFEKEDGKLFVAFESKAYCDTPATKECCCEQNYKYICEEFSYQMKWIREDISNLYKMFYEHKAGHIPAITDASKMKEALKALGLEKSFVVEEPRVRIEY